MILLFRELQPGSRPDILYFDDGYNDTFAAFQNRAAGMPQNENKRISGVQHSEPQPYPRFLLGSAKAVESL